MLKLDVPLLMIQGGGDENAPILNSDFAKIAFLASGKTNPNYWVYPKADHSFRGPGTGGSEPASIEKEVWKRARQWLEDHRASSKRLSPDH